MIIAGREPVEVGKRMVRCITDGQGQKHYDQPMVVLREATLTEYDAWCRENGSSFVEENLEPMGWIYFYEIVTD